MTIRRCGYSRWLGRRSICHLSFYKVGKGPARNSDNTLIRRLNGPKYFPLDRHATMPTVQCSENGTHWSEGQFVRLFKKEAH